MRIYVTGSTGMVGRNVVEYLNKEGYQVLTTHSIDVDLLNFENIKKYLLEARPDFIIHCAGKVGGIQANIKDAYGFCMDNMQMGLNLIRASKECEIKNFLNLSSSCSYPPSAKNPLKEESVFEAKLEPTNEGYAIAKASITKICEYLTNQFPGYSYKTIIPCNLYGKYDKFGDNNSHMIPAVIKKLHNAKINNLEEIEIWGDGTARREFMYAEDLAQMISFIVQNFASMPCIMNTGLGYDYTINEYYSKIANIVGYTGKFKHDLSKPTGMKQKLLDITKQTKFGIKSMFNLEEGIQKTYEYFIKEYEVK